jgi:bleomycin hydrolase
MRTGALTFFLLFSFCVVAQDTIPTGEDFSLITQVDHTGVKNQNRSATCWSFACISLLESELMRTTGKAYDLSEMFVVKHAFSDKAKKYIRMHGHVKFTSGGEFYDVMNVYKHDGIVPESVYKGKKVSEEKHVHGEMDEVLNNYVEAILSNESGKMTTVWDEGFDLVLNAYLGRIPNTFEYNDSTYSPSSFAQMLGIQTEDYVCLTSFTHHEFYQPFILEVPDNWSWGAFQNVKMHELTEIIEYALNEGYSLTWAGDVTEDYYSWEQGIAEIPEDFEKEITQETRQIAFDIHETTDDHGMHIVGLAENDEGKMFYLVKNSWGTENAFEGYMYLSKKYVQFKTTSLMVHKNGIPSHLINKLGLD